MKVKIRKILVCYLLIIFSVFLENNVVKGIELITLDTNINDNVGIINDTKKVEDKINEFKEKTDSDAYIYITNEKYSSLGDIDSIYNCVFFKNEKGVLIWIALNDKSIQIRTGSEARGRITDKICERMIESAKIDFKYEKYEDGIIDILDEGIRKYENKDGTLLEKFKKTWVYAAGVVICGIIFKIWIWGKRIDYMYNKNLNGESYSPRRFRRNHRNRSGFGGRGGASGGW